MAALLEPAGDLSKGELTRRSILEAAIERFGRDGFRRTSVAAVARDCGVGATVPYAYFDSKEALFLAAIDEDASGVIRDCIPPAFTRTGDHDWRRSLIVSLVASLEHHPLARRVLGGLEPEVTDRVLEIPALTDLRSACTERLRAEQAAGTVRADIDPERVGAGIVSLLLTVLMAVVQVGADVAARYSDDVIAVFDAALDPPR